MAVKGALAPGGRLAKANTVLGKAWLSVTTMLVRVTLPELVTVPGLGGRVLRDRSVCVDAR